MAKKQDVKFDERRIVSTDINGGEKLRQLVDVADKMGYVVELMPGTGPAYVQVAFAKRFPARTV